MSSIGWETFSERLVSEYYYERIRKSSYSYRILTADQPPLITGSTTRGIRGRRQK